MCEVGREGRYGHHVGHLVDTHAENERDYGELDEYYERKDCVNRMCKSANYVDILLFDSINYFFV